MKARCSERNVYENPRGERRPRWRWPVWASQHIPPRGRRHDRRPKCTAAQFQAVKKNFRRNRFRFCARCARRCGTGVGCAASLASYLTASRSMAPEIEARDGAEPLRHLLLNLASAKDGRIEKALLVSMIIRSASACADGVLAISMAAVFSELGRAAGDRRWRRLPPPSPQRPR